MYHNKGGACKLPEQIDLLIRSYQTDLKVFRDKRAHAS